MASIAKDGPLVARLAMSGKVQYPMFSVGKVPSLWSSSQKRSNIGNTPEKYHGYRRE